MILSVVFLVLLGLVVIGLLYNIVMIPYHLTRCCRKRREKKWLSSLPPPPPRTPTPPPAPSPISIRAPTLLSTTCTLDRLNLQPIPCIDPDLLYRPITAVATFQPLRLRYNSEPLCAHFLGGPTRRNIPRAMMKNQRPQNFDELNLTVYKI